MPHRSPESRRKDRRRSGDALAVAWTAAFLSVVSTCVVIFVSSTILENRGDIEQAVCAVVQYTEKQVASSSSPENLNALPAEQRPRVEQSLKALRELATNMRNTGIGCPPPK
jgi:hypothetical protein